MLEIQKNIHEQIKAHGAGSYPHEGCGLLLGHMTPERNIVTDILPVENKWPNEEEKPVRFRIVPEDMMQAELKAMRQGVDIIGIFHSHPNHPPVASPRDLAWATWPGYSYIITQIDNGVPSHSQSWQLADDRNGFVEEEILEINN